MRVQVARNSQFGVAKQKRDFRERNALSDQEARGGVPQIVEPHPWQLGGLEYVVQRPKHVARMKAGSHRSAGSASRKRREHEPRLAPVLPRLQPFLKLLSPVRAQVIKADLRKRERPSAPFRFQLL